MKLALAWIAIALSLGGISWLYHPSVELAAVSSLLLVLLAAVVSWSAYKLSGGKQALPKTFLVASVAGFMFSQAMDIAYSVLAAPAGLRLDLFLEVLSAAAIFTLVGLVSKLALARPRPKPEK